MGKKTATPRLKSITDMRLTCSPLKRRGSRWPGFFAAKKGATFSLLPNQLIPYCQYTVDAVVGTLLKVYEFQQTGQAGYHGVSLELESDCLVTP